MSTRERQVITKDDVAVLDLNSVLLTKATAAAQQSAQADMDKPDASLAKILARKEQDEDETTE